MIKGLCKYLSKMVWQKWTIYITEDLEPVKVIAVCEYENEESFQNAKSILKIFTKNKRPYHKN